MTKRLVVSARRNRGVSGSLFVAGLKPPWFEHHAVVPWDCYRFGKASHFFCVWPPGDSLALLFCLYPLGPNESFGNIPLVATGKLCFLPRQWNSWESCWQLAALPLPVQDVVYFGKKHFGLHDWLLLLYPDGHAFYPDHSWNKWSCKTDDSSRRRSKYRVPPGCFNVSSVSFYTTRLITVAQWIFAASCLYLIFHLRPFGLSNWHSSGKRNCFGLFSA